MVSKRNKVCIISLILFIFATSSFAAPFRLNPQWKEYRSEHFIIYYYTDIGPRYLREFSRKCEYYYRSITERLGFRRFNFWTWDNRTKIFLYDSQENYVQYVRGPLWCGASVHVQKKVIRTYSFEERFFDTLLAHEIAHIVLREFIGWEMEVPLWFEEGVACANEEGSYLRYLLTTKRLLNKGYFISVKDLEQVSNPQMRSKSYIPFYSIAASLVLFLLEEYGREDFIQLCRNLRDGDSFYAAMDRIYRIQGPEDLQDKFLSFLQDQGLQ